MCRQPPAVVRTVGGRQVEHERLDAVRDEPVRRLAREIGCRRRARVFAVRSAARGRAHDERRVPEAGVSCRGMLERGRGHETIARRRARVAVLAGVLRRDRLDRYDERELHAARHALMDGDARVGHVTHALRVGAIAVRRNRQHLAVAASAGTRVAHEASLAQRTRIGPGRPEGGRLAPEEVERDRDAGGSAKVDAQRSAIGLESHDEHRFAHVGDCAIIVVSRWNPVA
jgi:hypothetical protein